jgi:hypothetical protein
MVPYTMIRKFLLAYDTKANDTKTKEAKTEQILISLVKLYVVMPPIIQGRCLLARIFSSCRNNCNADSIYPVMPETTGDIFMLHGSKVNESVMIGACKKM